MKGSKRFLGWLLAAAFALLAAVVLIPLGMFVWHLQHQRALQVALDEQEGVHVFPAQSHWLSDWLPDSWHDYLPAGRVKLTFDNDDGLEQFRKIACRLDGISSLSFNWCPLTEEDWQAIFRERQLEELTLLKLPITAKQLGQLQSLPHLQRLSIAQVPLADESLVHFANCPALTHLALHNTRVTLPAIEAFAAAHPHISVGWNRRLTYEEDCICKELESLGIRIQDIMPNDYIAQTYRWHIGLSDEIALQPRVRELLQELGSVEHIDIKGRLTPEALELITSIPTIMSVNCEHVSSFDDIEKLASLPQIQSLYGVMTYGVMLHWPNVTEGRTEAFLATHRAKLEYRFLHSLFEDDE